MERRDVPGRGCTEKGLVHALWGDQEEFIGNTHLSRHLSSPDQAPKSP